MLDEKKWGKRSHSNRRRVHSMCDAKKRRWFHLSCVNSCSVSTVTAAASSATISGNFIVRRAHTAGTRQGTSDMDDGILSLCFHHSSAHDSQSVSECNLWLRRSVSHSLFIHRQAKPSWVVCRPCHWIVEDTAAHTHVWKHKRLQIVNSWTFYYVCTVRSARWWHAYSELH